jgi:DnaJ-class molecular chaperone
MKMCPDCDDCNWAGTIGNGKCKVCHGTGEDTFFGVDATRYDCEECGGSGVCPTCDGEGRVEED